MLSPRATAAQILNEVFESHCSLTDALADTLHKKAIDPRDKGFIQELCYGVMRWYTQLNTILKLLLTKPLKEKDQDIEALLFIGLYQLIHLQTPAHAALHETVEAAKELKKQWATKLINGVLRQFLRNQTEILEEININPYAVYAHPKWLLKMLQQAWPDQWQAIATANNERPPLTLRVNHLKTTTEEYLQQLQNSDLGAQIVSEINTALTLDTPCDVSTLPGFANGEASVQDAAAQLAAELLELQPGQTILDACAAPGGKTAHILELQPKLAQLIALDIDAKRLVKIQENIDRLQLQKSATAIKLISADAGDPPTWHEDQQFDRILLDAPCSATGVIRRHPDIKFLRRSEDIANLAATQLQLLENLWPLLKSGGILLYATCSVLPKENNLVLQKFLAKHTDAREKPITAIWGTPLAIGRQILPGESNMDGFYYARLEKV